MCIWLIYIRCWCKRCEHCANELVIASLYLVCILDQIQQPILSMTQTNHQPWTCGVCFWLFACDSEFVQLSCLWQRVTPEFDIMTAGKDMMTFHLRNVTAVSSNCKQATTIINSPYFLFLASPLLSPWRIYASCLTCTGRPCPAPTRWVTWLNVKLDAFQMWQV